MGFLSLKPQNLHASPSGHKLSSLNSLLNAAEPISQATHRAEFRYVLNVFETRVIQKQLKIGVHLRGKAGG